MNIEESKKPRLDLMLDIETCDNSEDAAILSISIVPFNRNGEPTELKSYNQVIDLTSCFMAGMKMTGCQKWWMKQDPIVISAIVNAPKKTIQKVMNEVHDYLSGLAETYDLQLWSRGTDYDFPKLEYGLRKFVEKEPPYKYSHKWDVRTIVKGLGIDESQFEFEGRKHIAIDDATHDIKLVQAAFAKISGK